MFQLIAGSTQGRIPENPQLPPPPPCLVCRPTATATAIAKVVRGRGQPSIAFSNAQLRAFLRFACGGVRRV